MSRAIRRENLAEILVCVFDIYCEVNALHSQTIQRYSVWSTTLTHALRERLRASQGHCHIAGYGDLFVGVCGNKIKSYSSNLCSYLCPFFWPTPNTGSL